MTYSTGSSYQKRPLWQWLVLYAIIGGLVYAAVYYVFFARRATPYTAPTATAQPVQTNAVTITATGFEPSNISVALGTSVTWTNQSGADVSINSSPHPQHTDFPFLNIGVIKNGETKSLIFDTAGRFTYHNHFKPTEYGIVNVQ